MRAQPYQNVKYKNSITRAKRTHYPSGFLLAFEARLAYLEKTPATEVSDGSTCTQGAIPGNRAGSSRHPHMAKRPSLERLRNFRQGTRFGCQQWRVVSSDLYLQRQRRDSA